MSLGLGDQIHAHTHTTQALEHLKISAKNKSRILFLPPKRLEARPFTLVLVSRNHEEDDASIPPLPSYYIILTQCLLASSLPDPTIALPQPYYQPSTTLTGSSAEAKSSIVNLASPSPGQLGAPRYVSSAGGFRASSFANCHPRVRSRTIPSPPSTTFQTPTVPSLCDLQPLDVVRRPPVENNREVELNEAVPAG